MCVHQPNMPVKPFCKPHMAWLHDVEMCQTSLLRLWCHLVVHPPVHGLPTRTCPHRHSFLSRCHASTSSYCPHGFFVEHPLLFTSHSDKDRLVLHHHMVYHYQVLMVMNGPNNIEGPYTKCIPKKGAEGLEVWFQYHSWVQEPSTYILPLVVRQRTFWPSVRKLDAPWERDLLWRNRPKLI